MPPKLPPKRPPFVPSPPRKAAAPMPPPTTTDTERCVACQGSGTSSRGKTCVPCGGSGRTQVKRPPPPKPPHRQRELLPVVDLVYGCPGTPSAVIAVLALDTFVDHGIRLFKSKDDAITWMVSQLIQHKKIALNDDGTYHHEGDDYINPEDVIESWQCRAEPSEYFQIIVVLPTTQVTTEFIS